MTPQDVWDVMSTAGHGALLWWAGWSGDEPKASGFVEIVGAKLVTSEHGHAQLTPLGRAVAEYGRGQDIWEGLSEEDQHRLLSWGSGLVSNGCALQDAGLLVEYTGGGLCTTTLGRQVAEYGRGQSGLLEHQHAAVALAIAVDPETTVGVPDGAGKTRRKP